MGDHLASRSSFQDAWKIQQFRCAGHLVSTSVTLANLGLAHLQLGEWNESKYYLSKALVIQREKLGGEHPMTAKTVLAKGLVLYNQFFMNEAHECFKSAYGTLLRLQGERHLDTQAAKALLDGSTERINASLLERFLRSSHEPLVSLPCSYLSSRDIHLSMVVPYQPEAHSTSKSSTVGLAIHDFFSCGYHARNCIISYQTAPP